MEELQIVSERIALPLSGDLRFVPKEALESWETGDFIVRNSALQVWEYVLDVVNHPLKVGAYLAGPMGVGKSSIMYYVVHKARKLRFLVVYIPKCDEWFKMGTSLHTMWFAYFFDAVLEGLKFVTPDIKEKYAYCFPTNGHSSWTRALILEILDPAFLIALFIRFRDDIRNESQVGVILAFDETQFLFENAINPLVTDPFSLIDWSSFFKKGCVFITATADSPYRRNIRAGHERYVLHVGCLSDEEVFSWFQSQHFANISKHPNFNDYIPEIRSLTGDIPRELVLLSEEYGCMQNIELAQIIENYSENRLFEYEQRFNQYASNYPSIKHALFKSILQFFVKVKVNLTDISMQFLDTGLAYQLSNSIIPLNTNALKCFFKMLSFSDEKEWENERIHELKNLQSDNDAQVGLAFERLFGLNLLSKGKVMLKFCNLDEIQEEREIEIRHFLTIPADKPKKSWKAYPVGTLVAHSKAGENRLDFIYFGGDQCVIFFEVTMAKDVTKSKYPNLSNASRLELILSSLRKWMGHSICISENAKLLPPRDFKGVIEYIVVSSRISSEGSLFNVVQRKKDEFPWIKVMTREGLKSFFPDSHILQLQNTITRHV